MNENEPNQDYELGDFLPKSVNPTLSVADVGSGFTARIAAFKTATTRYGVKLIATITTPDGKTYDVFVNKTSAAALAKHFNASKLEDLIDKEIQVSTAQAIVRGLPKQIILLQ
mgnify:CR=1 FL=1